MGKLTRWQVDWAEKLREDTDDWGTPLWSWGYIAAHLGCADATVAKAVKDRKELAEQLAGLKQTGEF